MFGLKIMTVKAYKAEIQKIQKEYNETLVAQEEENAALENENIEISNVMVFLANDAGIKYVCGYGIKEQAKKNRAIAKEAAEIQAAERAKVASEEPPKKVEKKPSVISRAEMTQAFYDVCKRAMQDAIKR